ncbi:nitrile hydratase [Loktanella atrilutea]|uniref:Nitrile hydratase n=1 Tax=Loktanella atrilutea TaxID=366533 RepID=A0A1M4V7G8_LOKAT|nr:nitrile hydratase [Loktanella atrilutea]
MPTPLHAEPGTRVRVRDWAPPGHIRTPAYLRGHIGTVERVLGPFPNPEDLAYRRPGAPLPLYRVRFAASDLWPDATPGDTLEAEIYAHWLEDA